MDTRCRPDDISRVPARSRNCWRTRHCSPRQSPAAGCGCLRDLHPGRRKSAERLRSGYPVYVVRVFDTRPQNGVKAGWPDRSLRLSPPRLGWGPPAAGHFFGARSTVCIAQPGAYRWPPEPAAGACQPRKRPGRWCLTGRDIFIGTARKALSSLALPTAVFSTEITGHDLFKKKLRNSRP